MKIKITKDEFNIKGNCKRKVIMPYGNTARIPESNKNIGKNIYVIYPDNIIYSWVFSNDELKQLLETAKKNLNSFETKHVNVYQNAIENIESDKFKKTDLKLIMELIINEKNLKKLSDKINRVYFVRQK